MYPSINKNLSIAYFQIVNMVFVVSAVFFLGIESENI